MSQMEDAPAPPMSEQGGVHQNTLIFNHESELFEIKDQLHNLSSMPNDAKLDELNQNVDKKNDSIKFIHKRRLYSVSSKANNEQNRDSIKPLSNANTPNKSSKIMAQIKGFQDPNIEPSRHSHQHLSDSISEENYHNSNNPMQLPQNFMQEKVAEMRNSISQEYTTGTPIRSKSSKQHDSHMYQYSPSKDKNNPSSNKIISGSPQESKISEDNLHQFTKSKKARQVFQSKKGFRKRSTLFMESADQEVDVTAREIINLQSVSHNYLSSLLSPKNLGTQSSGMFSDGQEEEIMQNTNANSAQTNRNQINFNSFSHENQLPLKEDQTNKNSNVILLQENSNKNDGKLQEIISAFDNEKTQTTEQEDSYGEHQQIQILQIENDDDYLDLKEKDEILVDAQNESVKSVNNKEEKNSQKDKLPSSARKSQEADKKEPTIKEDQLSLNTQNKQQSKEYSFQSPTREAHTKLKNNLTQQDGIINDYQHEDQSSTKKKTSNGKINSNVENIDKSKEINMNQQKNPIIAEKNKQENKTIEIAMSTSVLNPIQIENININNNNDGSQQTIEPMSVQKKQQGDTRIEGIKVNSHENSINSAETIKLHSAIKNFGDLRNIPQDHEEMPEVIEYSERKEPQTSSNAGLFRRNFQSFSDNDIGVDLNRSEGRGQGRYQFGKGDEQIREQNIEVLMNSDEDVRDEKRRRKDEFLVAVEEKGREHELSSVTKLKTEGGEEKKLEKLISQKEELPNMAVQGLNQKFEYTQYWGELRQQLQQQIRKQSCFECLKSLWPQKLTAIQRKEKQLILALSEELYSDSKPQYIDLLEQVRLLYRKFVSSNKKMTLIMHPDEVRKRIEKRETNGGTMFAKDTSMQVKDMSIFSLIQMQVFLSSEQAQKLAAGSKRLLRKVNLLFLLLRISNLVVTKIKENVLDGCIEESTDEFINWSHSLFKAVYSEAVLSLLEVTLEPNETNVKLYDNVDKIAKKLTSSSSVALFLRDAVGNQRFFGKTRNLTRNGTQLINQNQS